MAEWSVDTHRGPPWTRAPPPIIVQALCCLTGLYPLRCLSLYVRKSLRATAGPFSLSLYLHSTQSRVFHRRYTQHACWVSILKMHQLPSSSTEASCLEGTREVRERPLLRNQNSILCISMYADMRQEFDLVSGGAVMDPLNNCQLNGNVRCEAKRHAVGGRQPPRWPQRSSPLGTSLLPGVRGGLLNSSPTNGIQQKFQVQ